MGAKSESKKGFYVTEIQLKMEMFMKTENSEFCLCSSVTILVGLRSQLIFFIYLIIMSCLTDLLSSDQTTG